MRKPYATPEEYADYETAYLKRYANKLVYMITVMCEKHGVENAFDRHALGNAYDDLKSIKTVLDTRLDTYSTKLLAERILGILESEFAAYDQRGRESRISRRLAKAQKRIA